MGTARPPSNQQDHYFGPQPRGDDDVDVRLLLEENARLRGLVIQLSELVLRNVFDRN